MQFLLSHFFPAACFSCSGCCVWAGLAAPAGRRGGGKVETPENFFVSNRYETNSMASIGSEGAFGAFFLSGSWAQGLCNPLFVPPMKRVLFTVFLERLV